VEVDSPRERYSGRAIVLLKAKDSLRIEPLSFFGQPALYIVSHKEHLTIYSPGEGKYLQGKATPETLYLWLGVPVGPKEIVSILWGGLPELLPPQSLRIAYEETTGAYRLESLAPSGPLQRWWVDARTLHPLRAEGLSPDGRTQLAVQYGDYEEVGGVPLPGKVRIEVPLTHRSFGVTYRGLRLNEGISDLSFQLPVPEGAKIVSIDPGSPHAP
jgi:outer membrane lipoprotein-sorting protein